MSIRCVQDIAAAEETLVVAHKGFCFGLVAENSPWAYEVALAQGADILETDVARTRDDRFVILHGPELSGMSTLSGSIHDKDMATLDDFRFRTLNGVDPAQRLLTLEAMLEMFKGRCVINIDRAYTLPDMEDVYQVVKRHGMQSQVVFKAALPIKAVAQWLARRQDAHYIPIVRTRDEMDGALALAEGGEAAFPAVELVFRTEADMMPADVLQRMFDLRIKPWYNAITLTETLCAGHDDIVSMRGAPEAGWGWLIDHGARVIQTDCCNSLRAYLESRKKGAR